jgi:hypothetical protein
LKHLLLESGGDDFVEGDDDAEASESEEKEAVE